MILSEKLSCLFDSYKKYIPVLNGKDAQQKVLVIWRILKEKYKAVDELSRESYILQETWRSEYKSAKSNFFGSMWGSLEEKL